MEKPSTPSRVDRLTYIHIYHPSPPTPTRWSVGSGGRGNTKDPDGRDSGFLPVPASLKRIRARDADETPLDLITVKPLTAHNNDEIHTHAYA
eukprot:scaffold33238_cov129-Isochrysis_galbana.AAC.1